MGKLQWLWTGSVTALTSSTERAYDCFKHSKALQRENSNYWIRMRNDLSVTLRSSMCFELWSNYIRVHSGQRILNSRTHCLERVRVSWHLLSICYVPILCWSPQDAHLIMTVLYPGWWESKHSKKLPVYWNGKRKVTTQEGRWRAQSLPIHWNYTLSLPENTFLTAGPPPVYMKRPIVQNCILLFL